MAWELAGLDTPKNILKIVEKPEEEAAEDTKWKWVKWVIKPVNYIANRVREFLVSPSSK